MKIYQAHDATRLNEIVNHPSVYEWVRGLINEPLDLTDAVRSDENTVLMGEHGAIVFTRHQPGIYEAHTQVLPDGRGRWAVDLVNECLSWMFLRTDAVEIWTRCPKGNIAAKALTKAIGGVESFTAQSGWVRNGEIIPATIYRICIQDWMDTSDERKWLPKSGLAQLEPDENRDRYVGVACGMLLSGQEQKAAIFYNRFASMSGYAPALRISKDPLIVSFAGYVVSAGPMSGTVN